MKEISFKLLVSEIIRYLLISLFLYTAYHKISDFKLFEDTLLRSRIISEYYGFVKYALPISEFIVVFLLFLDKFKLYGLYASLFLLVSFTFYLIVLNNFSVFHGCSCGGVFNKMSYSQHLAINFFSIIINIIAIFIDQKIKNNEK